MMQTQTMVVFEIPTSAVPRVEVVDPEDYEGRGFLVVLTLDPVEVNVLEQIVHHVQQMLDDHFENGR